MSETKGWLVSLLRLEEFVGTLVCHCDARFVALSLTNRLHTKLMVNIRLAALNLILNNRDTSNWTLLIENITMPLSICHLGIYRNSINVRHGLEININENMRWLFHDTREILLEKIYYPIFLRTNAQA